MLSVLGTGVGGVERQVVFIPSRSVETFLQTPRSIQSTMSSSQPTSEINARPSQPNPVPPAETAQVPPAEMTEYERMTSGQPYLAMTDPSLLLARLRVRRPMQKYNQYEWPDSQTTDDYFGPDERRRPELPFYNAIKESGSELERVGAD